MQRSILHQTIETRAAETSRSNRPRVSGTPSRSYERAPPRGSPGEVQESLAQRAWIGLRARPQPGGSEDTRLFSHIPEAGRPRCRCGQGWSLLSLSPGRVDATPPHVPFLPVDPLHVSLKTLSPKLVPNASQGCGARPVNVERHSSAQQKRCRFSTK